MNSSSSSESSVSGRDPFTGSNKVIFALVALVVAVAVIFALWMCFRQKRKSGSRNSNSQITEYVDCQLTPNITAIGSNESLRSSSSVGLRTKWFPSGPSLELNNQHTTTCVARESFSAVTTIAIESTTPVENGSLWQTDDINEEMSCNLLALEQRRLPPQSVVDDKLLHIGSFTMTFRATIKTEGQTHRHVVVRRLLPELAEQQSNRLAFMTNISLAAAFVHPNIVTFIGVYDPTQRVSNFDAFLSTSWQDVQPSAVTEYMPNGDLRTLLTRQSRHTNDFGWFHSTVMSKTKAQVALDIVDGLVYLHSRPSDTNTPQHHLQLKAQRVLLSEYWDAKLCAFGVHRASGTTTTTSRTDLSVAWLAPELLRGERRSEQSDVYALGVLLTELDTCELPFSSGVDMDDGMSEQTQLALLVSSGCIRPTLSMDCPLQIQELVMRCLSFSPEQRSPAIEVQHTLRKLINGTSVCNLSLSSLPSNVS